MFGLGTIINVAAIVLGGLMGLLCGKRLSQSCQETMTRAMGVCVLFVGIAGTMEKMLVIENGALASQGTLMMVISIALGGLVGELLKIDHGIERFGAFLRDKTGNGADNRFLDAFITATMTVCIGAMAVVGSVQDGILGDYTILAAKALLDFFIIMIMAASLGKGSIFSAVPVFLFQGSITLLARVIEPLLTVQALANLSLVGSVLIFCVGLNLVFGKMIRVANLLPGLIAAVAWALLGL